MVKWKKVAKDTILTGGIVGGTALAGSYLSNRGSSNKSSSSSNASKNKSKTNTTGDTGEGTDTGDSSGSSSGDSSSSDTGTTTKTKVEEVPIDNYEEAMNFANREWNKIKRNNGRILECQVQGSSRWRVGEWCKVYLPSFDIDGFMYIVRVSQTSDGGDWSTNLSLADYPPGWGREDLTENKEEEEEEEEGEDGENTDGEEGTGEGTDTGDTGTT